MRTMPTSHIVEYLGRDSLSSKVFSKETGYQGMFSKSRLISWYNSGGQGGSNSFDSTVADPLFVK